MKVTLNNIPINRETFEDLSIKVKRMLVNLKAGEQENVIFMLEAMDIHLDKNLLGGKGNEV